MRAATSILLSTLTVLPLLAGCDPLLEEVEGEVTLRDGVCESSYETYTQSQWGSVCSGDNAGCLRNKHFMQVFPEGLIVGCGVLTANLVTSAAVEKALPTAGSPRALFPAEAVAYDGVGDPKVGTSLFGQVVALGLNVGFDEYAFAPDPKVPLESLVISDPFSPCYAMTVGEVLTEANLALGGCESSLDPATANACALAINHAFAGGVTCSPLFRAPTASSAPQ